MIKRFFPACMLALGATALPAPTASAEEKCRNPPPVFDCNDWRKSSSGRLVAKRDLTAGLLGMTEGSYIGTHTMIDGLDYSEALRKQCGGT